MARFTLPRPVQNLLARVHRGMIPLYKRYMSFQLWLQVIIAFLLIVVVLGAIAVLAHLLAPKDTSSSQLPTVTLSTVGELAGGASSVGVIGDVRSMTEASILAQSGGAVTRVHTGLGASVPAGFVLAELENASQQASVLQAEGSYDAAIAARAGASPADITASAQNTYTSSYNSLDSILKTYVDAFYGDPGAQGPKFLIGPTPYDFAYFSSKRATLVNRMDTWHSHLATANTTDPQVLLAEASSVTQDANSLATDIATAATRYGSDASASQLSALASARSGIAGLQASITAAKQSNQSQGTGATAGANASVKIALGTLRAAQAGLEKTLIRAPIGGQVNFLPIRADDYVTPLEHVATVAQNGALEIVTSISEENRSLLSVGTKVTIEGGATGVVTSISPALDPVTKQVEVHIAVTGDNNLPTGKAGLVNGQSVHVNLPGASVATVKNTGLLLLPLTALKLTPSARVVFSIGADGRLVAHPVEIGDVRSDRIEITSDLPSDLRIVTDARGLSDGQKVQVATTP